MYGIRQMHLEECAWQTTTLGPLSIRKLISWVCEHLLMYLFTPKSKYRCLNIYRFYGSGELNFLQLV
jgi:hypothetical protein